MLCHCFLCQEVSRSYQLLFEVKKYTRLEEYIRTRKINMRFLDLRWNYHLLRLWVLVSQFIFKSQPHWLFTSDKFLISDK